MGRRKRYYRSGFRVSNNILRLSRSERQIFDLMTGFIKFSFMFAFELGKGLYKLGKYIRKIVYNFYALKKIGYDLDYVMSEIYNISPRQFEIFIAELFKQHGYTTHLTPPSNDGGVDVILTTKINGQIETTFVEVKHFTHKTKVSRPIIQKLLGSSMMYKGDKCIVVTCGEYTKEALECVNHVNNLKLMDITDIQKMMLDLKPEQIAKVILKTQNCA